ncbi:MAG: hydantoinase/oxoprolinase family protein [Wenzhouxiangella sp.]
MAYHLGVDVGGTFTDLLLINDDDGTTYTAKVLSTPEDSSIGVLSGVKRICSESGVDPREITWVMHGTTVATNAVLTGKGASVGLVTTLGYRDVLQVARSFCPGGLGGWVSFVKSPLLAPLELTVEAHERTAADGAIVEALDEVTLKSSLEELAATGRVEALTICFINAYVNCENEVRAREVARQVFSDIPISISSELVPEMQEYERTETTVVNSYVSPQVSKYLNNLQRSLEERMGENVQLTILRSDGGLAPSRAAADSPVNHLLSGPAGGVAGALHFCRQAGYKDILTFDMGGTSTDVALIQNGRPRTRRETRVGDVVVRAPSVDVRTVGAGGGSIAFVPELTRALRVGPDSAGADPGPAAYMKGGQKPTVCDANVVLGFLPANIQLGGKMAINREAAEKAVQQVADDMGIDLMEAAEGIIKIVNESMFGALRLVSVEQGFDPREFALVGFGGAGPLHANALGRLTGSWPVIIPPGPGVLCAYGDATTQIRDEASKTYVRMAKDISAETLLEELEVLRERAAETLDADGISRGDQEVTFQADLRYAGQAFEITIEFSAQKLKEEGLKLLTGQFDAEHDKLFSFALGEDHELLMIRAIVKSRPADIQPPEVGREGLSLEECRVHDSRFYHEGQWHSCEIYERSLLHSGLKVPGPAIVIEMDSTTVILPDHSAIVDEIGNLLITPDN